MAYHDRVVLTEEQRIEVLGLAGPQVRLDRLLTRARTCSGPTKARAAPE